MYIDYIHALSRELLRLSALRARSSAKVSMMTPKMMFIRIVETMMKKSSVYNMR